MMCASEGITEQIDVQIVGSHGLVWSIPDVLKLRTEHRIVGCMVGGIAKFHSQVAVGGLPLQLSQEEVTLALKQGLVRLYHIVCKVPVYTHEAAAAEQQRQQQQQERRRQQEQLQQQPWRRDVEQVDEYYAEYYGLPVPQQQQQQQQQQRLEQQQQQQQQQQRLDRLLFVIESIQVSSKQHKQQTQQQQQCVVQQQQDLGLVLQLTSLQHHNINERKQQQHQQQQQQQSPLLANVYVEKVQETSLTDAQEAADHDSSSSSSNKLAPMLLPVQWHYPHSPQQHMRYLVFQDLHAQGYFLTNGAKFGGDYLAYPGDPNLYHAQFVVRVLPADYCLDPVTFKGIARGVHAARKHLLLATVDEDELQVFIQQQQIQEQHHQEQQGGQGVESAAAAATPMVRYITVAKENGFGASKT